MNSLQDKVVLITGGTGSLGKRLVEVLLRQANPHKLIIFSRGEFAQSQLRRQWPIAEYPNLRFVVGCVRDRDALFRALDGVDVVIHAAAIKQIPTAEANPLEAIKTNIIGSANVMDVAIDRGVERVMALSTDKAANPINLYGATKLCMDKMYAAANATSGKTRLSTARYGNVVGSRGSVIPYFLGQRSTGCLTVTDPRMTRFWITLDQAVKFVLDCLDVMWGGEIFIPKIPSIRILDLARIVGPECEYKTIGIRPGEKLHEVLVPKGEAHLTLEFDDYFVIQTGHSYWDREEYLRTHQGTPCPEGFSYTSDTNPWWLTDDEIMELVNQAERELSPSDLPKPDEPKFTSGL